MKKLPIVYFFTLLLLIGGIFFIITINKKERYPPLKASSQVISPVIVSPTPTLVKSINTIMNNSKVIPGNLKQYTSKQYAYSFLYPSDWQILDEPNLFGIEILKINSNGSGFSISLRINDNPKKLPLEDYAKDQAFPMPDGTQDIPEKITVANVQGYKLHHLPEGLLLTVYLPYKENDKVLYIFTGGEFDKSAQTLSYYNRITDNFLTSLKLDY